MQCDLATICADVAQLDRVPPSEGGSRTFESCHPRQYLTPLIVLRRSAQGNFQQRQAEQGVAGGNQVIGHHAKTIFDMLVKVTGRLRFGDIEEAEQGKGRSLPEEGIRREQEDQPERDDFVPDNAAMIGITQTLTGFVDDPDAEKIGRGQPAEKSQIAEVVAQQRKTQPGQ